MKKLVKSEDGEMEMIEEETEDALIEVLTEICKELRRLRERLDDSIYVRKAYD